MERQTTRLRKLLRDKTFLHMPSVYDAIGGRLVQSLGFEAAYVGGYVTGGSKAVTEPLLTMTEQVDLAGEVAAATTFPVLADAGAGFGDALHTMRTVREFIHAGVAGVHIEDQLFPKRAHYHKYVVHGVPVEEFVEKIRYSIKQRDESDKDFVVIARTDTCRALGLEEASMRLNRAADAGADMGLLFPRNLDDAEKAPKACRLPLVYVQSRGNRDGRPIISRKDLQQMGYVACIEAQVVLCTAFHFLKKALAELRQTGEYKGMSQAEYVASRQQVEDLIDLSKYYEIESQTVEARQQQK
ncbi:MAG TPA: isocitrate lyase/PEP mutase family protein [Burkholderiales bacterium]|jgi:methylisocitrate lyase|nr:isocitrate lyase/PEP mutase family protein [Burkholderiales bacterium]